MEKPKLKLKTKRIVDMDEERAPAELVHKFNQAFDELGHILVDRGNDIEALKLCLLSRNHLMLDGLHGTSKSLFASEAFRRIEGGIFFEKQFMKGTPVDEIFGPMKTERYRKDAVWEYNVEGMLPRAHFAFLDEVYRASDLVLPSMMGILNERKFINGGKVEKCPLITAIATTNFVSTEEELDAFKDRFLVTSRVLPLNQGASRLRMINLFLAKKKHSPTTISLVELAQLHKLVREVKFSPEVLEMYEELVQKYKRALGKDTYISDRRYCETLHLMQAFHVISDKGTEQDSFEPENLISASYGLHRLNDDKETDAFQQVFTTVVGNYVTAQTDVKNMDIIKQALEDIESDIAGANTKLLSKLHKKARMILETLQNTPGTEMMPKSTKGIELFDQNREMANELVSVITDKVGIVV